MGELFLQKLLQSPLFTELPFCYHVNKRNLCFSLPVAIALSIDGGWWMVFELQGRRLDVCTKMKVVLWCNLQRDVTCNALNVTLLSCMS